MVVDNEAFGLYLVLTRPVAGYERCAEAAVEYGLRYVQLRMKDEPRENVLGKARRLKAIVAGTATRLIVNDDVSIALACDADGVHLGQADLPVDEARRQWDAPGKVYGISTHDEQQAACAWTLRPDYIGVGPIFPTPTKATPDPLLGIVRAAAIVRASPLPCVGIGGINEQNLTQVLAAGIDNFAVVRAICGSDRPQDRIRDLMEIWRRGTRTSVPRRSNAK